MKISEFVLAILVLAAASTWALENGHTLQGQAYISGGIGEEERLQDDGEMKPLADIE